MPGDEFIFEAARGGRAGTGRCNAGQIVWIATVFFRQSCRFAQARVASLEKPGTGRVLFTLGDAEVASGHSAPEELGGHTDHLQPS
jgi:hypothetical protein